MASLRELVVSITAKTAAFEQKMEGTSKRLKKFGKDTKELRGQIGALFGGVSVAGFGYLIKDAIDAGDRMQKLGQQLGVSTEALSQLSHAAKLSGTDLESVSTGIKMMEKNIGDAKRGTGEAIVAFNQLGISAQKLGELTPDQQMAVLADALQKVKNPADRASLAMKIFGESGVKLLPMLKDGSAGLTAMMAEADALGVTLDQKTANSMAAFNDQITKTSGQMMAMVRNIASDILPGMGMLADAFGQVVPRAISAFRGALDGVFGIFTVFKGAFSDLAGLFAEFASGLAGFVGMDAVSEKLATFAQRLKDTADAARLTADTQFAISGEEFSAAFSSASDEATRFSGIAATIPPALESVAGHTDTLAEKTKKAADAQKAFNDMVKEAQGFIDQTRTPLEEYQQQMTRLAELFESGAFDSLGGLETYQQTVQRMAEEFKASMDGATDDGKGKIDELAKIGEEGAKSMQSAMESFFTNPTAEGFDQLLQSFLQILAQMAAQAAAAKITQALFGTSGGTGDASSALSGAIVSGISGMFANGGPVGGGRPILVGERGPELIVPAGAGNVIPTEKLKGGSGQNIVMNINTPNADSFRKSDQQIVTEMGRRLRGAQRNM